MYTIIRQVTNNHETTGRVMGESDHLTELNYQMQLLYSKEIASQKNYMVIKIVDQLVIGYAINNCETTVIYYIVNEDERIVSKRSLL